jgi:hypothetical protein
MSYFNRMDINEMMKKFVEEIALNRKVLDYTFNVITSQNHSDITISREFTDRRNMLRIDCNAKAYGVFSVPARGYPGITNLELVELDSKGDPSYVNDVRGFDTEEPTHIDDLLENIRNY